MTRGQIVLITENGVTTSIEFNGDMYYDGHGETVIAALNEIRTEEEYRNFVSKFNKQNFEYEENLFYNACEIEVFQGGECKTTISTEEELFDFSKDYFDKWFSDYLYIKNLRNADVKMTDDNGVGLLVSSGGVLMLNFGAYTDECSEHSSLVKVILSERIKEICESLDWKVFCNENDDRVELEKHSPAGEDFIFDVSISKFAEDVKEYADDFVPDEHAETWIELRGTHGVPISIRALIDDADAIQEMLKELAEAIEKA